MVFGVSSGSTEAFHIGLVLTAFGFGFRHGIDWDHIAALTDITSSQSNPRRSMRYATLYAVGHGLVVFTLGFVAIVFARRLPASIDATMERVVGATLIALGIYVVYSLIHNGRDFRMRSRWMLLFSGLQRCLGRAERWTRRSSSKSCTNTIMTIGMRTTPLTVRLTPARSSRRPVVAASEGKAIDTCTATSASFPTTHSSPTALAPRSASA